MHSSSVSVCGRVIGAALALCLGGPPGSSARAAGAAPIPLTAAPGTSPTPEPTTEANVHLPTVEEIRMGREAVVEVEKEYKLVTDEAQLKRLRTIGDEIL